MIWIKERNQLDALKSKSRGRFMLITLVYAG